MRTSFRQELKIKKGRPLKIDGKKVVKLKMEGKTQRQVAETMGISLSSVKRYWYEPVIRPVLLEEKGSIISDINFQ